MIPLLVLGLFGVEASAGEPMGKDLYGDPLPRGALARLGTTRLRHGGPIGLVGFLPDGKTLVSSGGHRDVTVRLWDFQTGAEVSHFRLGRQDDICTEFSPDCRWVAFISRNGVVRLWDVRQGKELRRFGRPYGKDQEPAGRLSFCARQRRIARLNEKGEGVEVWDSDTGQCLKSFALEGRQEPLWQLRLSPDATVLAGEQLHGGVSLWELRTGRKLPSPHEAEWPLVFSPDGKTLACTNKDGSVVRLWDALRGKELHELRPPLHAGSLVFSPDGRTLAMASYVGGTTLWDVRTGKILRTLESPGTANLKQILFLDPHTLISASITQGEVRVWSCETGKTVDHFALGFQEEGLEAALSPDRKTLAVAGARSGAIRLRRLRPAGDLPRGTGHCSFILTAALAPDGAVWATGGMDGSIRLWDARTARQLQRIPTRGRVVDALAFTPDGKALASLEPIENVVVLYEVATGRKLRVQERPQIGPSVLELSGDARLAAWGCGDGTIRLREVATDKERAHLDVTPHWKEGGYPAPKYRLAAFSPAGERLAAHCDWDRYLTVWETAGGQRLPRILFEEGPLARIALSPDGKLLAGACFLPGLVHLWEVATGKECLRFRLTEPGPGPNCMSFSPDGRTLLVGTEEETVRLLDVARGQARTWRPGHRDFVLGFHFSPDGRTLLTAGGDTTALLWDARAVLPPPEPGKIAPGRLEVLWKDLADADAHRAHRAIWALIAAPEQAVVLLEKPLEPVQAVTEERIRLRIAELDDDDFAVRQSATRALENLDRQAEEAICQALKETPSAEVQRRLRQVLGVIRGVPGTDVLRSLRAVQVLEHVATLRARQLLERLAGGAARARLTQEARAALRRLARPGVLP